jgi:16S rRNA (guanine966-N2)-methyltransferase
MSTLRITGGELRGRRVPVPAGELRPTSERARQAYFNIIGERIDGARFLELFAGSGIFSFEAVSRGASAAVTIEKSRKAAEAINRFARELTLPIEALSGDAMSGLARLTGEPFHLVYADPPYDYDRYDELLAAVVPRLTDDAIVAVEHRRNTEPFKTVPEGLAGWRTAQYGEVWISFFATPSSMPQPLQ